MSLFGRLFEGDEDIRSLERQLASSPDDMNLRKQLAFDKERVGDIRAGREASIFRKQYKIRPGATQPLSKEVNFIGPERLRKLRTLTVAARNETDPLRREILNTLADRSSRRSAELVRRKGAWFFPKGYEDAQNLRLAARAKLRTLQAGRHLGAETPEEADDLVKRAEA